ncbi:MAG: hypothetical protein BM557_02865 [Flavobacterium sp. MedPE-SWcel]|uniref:SPOR domain-containing protein n=1 Tax=uncultured Flavobacterium sp. TaxID=165435 RepID=UPI00091B04E8|nr:SPOR domain-containing protein [uncultured Flavobacterium sp.]OIQ21753.1 MAG: hypothetical protein BM557_02865 [Flavobacterium sp. MedPE-SWcel]
MRILKIRDISIVVLFATLSTAKSFAQKSEINIQQDEKFVKLLEDKRKINSSITVNDRYKIQIFYSDSSSETKKTLKEFRKEFPDISSTIIFDSPTYKIWAGGFNMRINAERTLKTIKETYPYALLIKPNK